MSNLQMCFFALKSQGFLANVLKLQGQRAVELTDTPLIMNLPRSSPYLTDLLCMRSSLLLFFVSFCDLISFQMCDKTWTFRSERHMSVNGKPNTTQAKKKENFI